VSASTSITTLTPPTGSDTRIATGKLPHPAHIVVVVMENHSYADIIGNRSAPWLNSLAETGALFTRSFAITHPSEPNYLALFSGSTHGLSDDSCPHRYTGPNLAAQLLQARDSFAGYAESLPRPGYTGCSHGDYARKHVPWTDFPALPPTVNESFTAFPHDYSTLPTIAFVIPNLAHDMHNGTITQGDQWLQRNLGRYATWARSHDSLLIVTWDEDDNSAGNHIPTIIAGANVKPGRYREQITHYRLLRTLDALARLRAIGAAATTSPVTDIWTNT